MAVPVTICIVPEPNPDAPNELRASKSLEAKMRTRVGILMAKTNRRMCSFSSQVNASRRLPTQDTPFQKDYHNEDR